MGRMISNGLECTRLSNLGSHLGSNPSSQKDLQSLFHDAIWVWIRMEWKRTKAQKSHTCLSFPHRRLDFLLLWTWGTSFDQAAGSAVSGKKWPGRDGRVHPAWADTNILIKCLWGLGGITMIYHIFSAHSGRLSAEDLLPQVHLPNPAELIWAAQARFCDPEKPCKSSWAQHPGAEIGRSRMVLRFVLCLLKLCEVIWRSSSTRAHAHRCLHPFSAELKW